MICKRLSDCVTNRISSSCFDCESSERCLIVADTRSNIKCEEKGKVYILENPKRNLTLLYQMDGGIISVDATVPSNICKCDNLFVTVNKSAILAELKGRDVTHALEQIDGTLDLFKNFFLECQKVYGRIVVASATPNLTASPQFTKVLLKCKKMHGDLIVKEHKYSEYIE